jgi:hypothetical protein
MAASRPANRARVWLGSAAALVLIAAGAGSYVAVSAGGGGAGATPTQEPSTATATATAETPVTSATATPPLPTSQPSAEPTATSGPIHPGITCPDGEPRYHLNIQKFQDELRQYPDFQDAVVTEVDLDTVMVETAKLTFTVTGWGEVVGIGGPSNPTNDLLEQLSLAMDAVSFDC